MSSVTAFFFFIWALYCLAGKSLYVKRCREKLADRFEHRVQWYSSTIRFLEKDVDVDDVINTLTHCNGKEIANADPQIVHIDITPAVSLLLMYLN